MSKPITISQRRLQELIEIAIANTRAEQSAEAPDTTVNNSNVTIHNYYGDTYEEDKELAPPAPAPTAPRKQSEGFAIRKPISDLFIAAEKKARYLEERNPHGFTDSAKSAAAALDERFDELKLRLKGDTSLENIRDAYIMMALQLCYASGLSGVFTEDFDG